MCYLLKLISVDLFYSKYLLDIYNYYSLMRIIVWLIVAGLKKNAGK